MPDRKKPSASPPARLPRFKTVVVAVALVLALLLVVLNWAALSTPVQLQLLVRRVEAPLGILLTAVVGLAALAFVVLFARLEAVTLRRDRRVVERLENLEEIVEDGQRSSTEQLAGIADELRELRSKSSDQRPADVRADSGPA